MNVELTPYRRFHLTCPQLCVAAAVLEIPCLYGVSDQWIRKSGGNLRRQILEVADDLKQKGWLLPGLDGEMRMDADLYQLLRSMDQAERLVRISYCADGKTAHVYLYRKAEHMVFLEEDEWGGWYLGAVTCGQLCRSLEKVPEETDTCSEGEMEPDPFFGLMLKEWMGALVFERKDKIYETVLDLAWQQDGKKQYRKGNEATDTAGGLKEIWKDLCRCI